MRLKKISWLILISGVILSLPLMLTNDDILFNVFGFVIFVIFSIVSVKGNTQHPYTIIFPIFMLYTISAPILVKLSLLKYRETYHLSIFYHYIALITFAMVVTPRVRNFNFSQPFLKDLLRKKYVKYKESVFFLLIPFFIITLVYIFFLVKSGINSKYERALSNNPFAFLGFSFNILTTLLALLIVIFKIKNNQFPYKFVFLVIIYFILSFFFTGERHTVFKLLLVIIILYSFLVKKISGLVYLFLITLGLFVNVFAQQIKMLFLKHTVSVNLSLSYMLGEIFYTEFKSSCRNLSILLEYVPKHINFLYGKGIFMDLSRAFTPGFLFPHATSTTIWFNKTFFPEFFSMGGGVGFSLVGVGYLNFGVIGIIMLFAFFGYIIKKLYLNANNPIILVVYSNFLPLFIFAFRGDLSIIFSQVLKHIMLPIFLVVLVDAVLKVVFYKGRKSECS